MFNTLYEGGFRTRTFADIFPNVETFTEELTSSGIPVLFAKEETITALYYLLYARYGNSHNAYSDENQFKYSIFSTIFMYGPTWEKRLDIQGKIRGLSENEILTGGFAVYNHSFNPSTAPSPEILTTINEQNTTKHQKSKLEGYAVLIDLLDTDVTEEFINKFKKLFITVTATGIPLLYETEIEK